MPKYTLKPGAYKQVAGSYINQAYVEFDSDFELEELVI
jgi:hypothetical protein